MKQIVYPTELDGLWVGSVYIHEPGGLVTNAIMSALCFVFLWKSRNCECKFSRNWRYFFLSLGLGTLGGCFTHGFPNLLGESLFYDVWFFKNAFVPMANMFALLGIAAAYGKSERSWIRLALYTKAMITIVLLGLTKSFVPVAIDLGISYILLVAFSALSMKRSESMRYIFYAFLCSILSGFFYIFQYDFDRLWLTHKDMVHVFAFVSIWLIFKAIRSAPEALPVDFAKQPS